MSEQKYSGIILQKSKVQQMDIHDIIVTTEAIEYILHTTKLSKEHQEETVAKLVARTPDYHELEMEDALAKITTALTQESVVAYLAHEGIIDTDKHDVMYECGIDEEGSVHVKVMYPNTPRDIRRMLDKKLSKEEKANMEQIVEKLGNDPVLLKAAEQRLIERAKEAKKSQKKTNHLKRIK